MNDERERRRRTALAALALDEAPAAAGGRPTLDELSDWIAGALPAARAAEVREHVARDPGVFEDWRQLKLAADEPAPVDDDVPVAATSSSGSPVRSGTGGGSFGGGLIERLREWLGPVPLGAAFATVAAVGLGLAVLTRPSAPEVDPWADWQVPKSVVGPALAPEERPELQTVLVGVREQLRDLSLPPFGPGGRALPEEVDGCTDPDAECAARRESLRELGRLGVLARIECSLGTDGELTAERQRTVGRILVELEDQATTARLAGPLRAWAAAETRAARCAAVDDVLSRSLTVADAS